MPASVTGSTHVTLTAELNDDSYTSGSLTFAGIADEPQEITDGEFSGYGTASDLRAEDDKTIVLTLSGEDTEDVTYTINVTIQT